MTTRTQHPTTAPRQILFTLLQPGDTTQPGDVILFEGFYHPCSIVGVTADNYDAPIYRPAAVEEKGEVAA